MKNRLFAVMTFLTSLVVLAASIAGGADGAHSPEAGKKVLVELYISQGCNSCPPASKLLGQLGELGFGPDRIVPIAFHVDYFNDPWKDPFSDSRYSRRQWSYNIVQKREDLYFTPMMMIDGREPMLGSDRAKALPAIRRALGEPPGVKLKLAVDGAGRSRKLNVEVAADTAEVVGRDLLVCVSIVEDPVATDVPAGENAGKTLVEHHTVRGFTYKTIRLSRTGSKSLAFPLKVGTDWVAENCRVATFVQDQENGKVYQADSLPWTADTRTSQSPAREPRR
jgi:hypothetical protein